MGFLVLLMLIVAIRLFFSNIPQIGLYLRERLGTDERPRKTDGPRGKPPLALKIALALGAAYAIYFSFVLLLAVGGLALQYMGVKI